VVERHKVLLFLELMKRTAQIQFTFVGRQKTLESFAKLGITRSHAEQLVLGMRPENYVSGPLHLCVIPSCRKPDALSPT